MVVLDTDHLSLLEGGSSVGTQKLRARLARFAPGEAVTTIVNFEEQMRGWLSFLARARTVVHQVEAYRRLEQHLDNYRRIPVLGFNESAAVEFRRLENLRLRIGTFDLKIAAIVLSNGARCYRGTSRISERFPTCALKTGRHEGPVIGLKSRFRAQQKLSSKLATPLLADAIQLSPTGGAPPRSDRRNHLRQNLLERTRSGLGSLLCKTRNGRGELESHSIGHLSPFDPHCGRGQGITG